VSRVLILGANGQIARIVRDRLLSETDHDLTLYLRRSKRLTQMDPQRETVIDGDVNDTPKLTKAMSGQDIVYANLGGVLETQTQSIVNAMYAVGVKQLIFVSGLGIYDEVPGKFGEWNKQMVATELVDSRKAADILEESDLYFTILRCAWMTDDDVIDYEITEKGEPFKGTIISRKSVADLIMKLIQKPELHVRGSIGVNQPNTDGDKPRMY
jgi:uncharacterized protein YbjT (DUF2867 family)